MFVLSPASGIWVLQALPSYRVVFRISNVVREKKEGATHGIVAFIETMGGPFLMTHGLVAFKETMGGPFLISRNQRRLAFIGGCSRRTTSLFHDFK
jgi:hypothetical protein